MVDKLKKLPIYWKAVAFCSAVTAILERPVFRANEAVRTEIQEASDSITANMEEGFERSSDAELARFLHYSKGSVGEVLDRFRSAKRKGHVTQPELDDLVDGGEELQRMLAGWIRYLGRSNFRDRGRHRANQEAKEGTKKPQRDPNSR